jgi:hypothetical protein
VSRSRFARAIRRRLAQLALNLAVGKRFGNRLRAPRRRPRSEPEPPAPGRRGSFLLRDPSRARARRSARTAKTPHTLRRRTAWQPRSGGRASLRVQEPRAFLDRLRASRLCDSLRGECFEETSSWHSWAKSRALHRSICVPISTTCSAGRPKYFVAVRAFFDRNENRCSLHFPILPLPVARKVSRPR